MTSDGKFRPVNTNAGKEPNSEEVGHVVLSAQDRAVWLSAVEPTREDRERLRAAVWMAVGSASMSTTAHAVDNAMAAYAEPVAGSAVSSGLGLKLGASVILLSSALIGAVVWWPGGTAAPRTAATVNRGSQRPLAPTSARLVEAPVALEQPVVAEVTEARSLVPVAHKRGALTKHTVSKNDSQTGAEPRSESEVVAELESGTEPRQPMLDLAEELRLLREASAALIRHDHAAALRWLREHTVRFPRGALAKEAGALNVMLLCEQRDVHASAQRDAFLRAEASSPLAERVRQACAQLPEDRP